MMAPRLLSAAFLSAGIVMGCSQHASPSPVGTWKVDLASVVATPGPSDPKPSKQELDDSFSKVQIEFKKDGTAVSASTSSIKLQWTQSGNLISMTREGKSVDDIPTLTISDDGKRIHASGPAGEHGGKLEMDFVRAQ